MIDKIKVINYKSFSEKEFLLKPFNVVIGANSVGKSNFLDVFKFIQSAVSDGLTRAIRKRYGWSGIKCRRLYKKDIEFQLSGDFGKDHGKIRMSKNVTLVPMSYNYSFRFCEKQKFKYSVNSENLDVNLTRYTSKEDTIGTPVVSHFARTEKENQKVTIEELFVDSKSREVLIPELAEEKLFLNARFMSLGSAVLSEYIEKWRFYKLDPEIIRNPRFEEETDFVSEKGETLALILNRLEKIEKNPNMSSVKDKILNIMTMLVPGFEKWETEEFSDGRISFKIKEKKTLGAFMPIQISDGTLHLLGILTALFYHKERPTLICIEEPERNIHPLVLQELVNVMRDVSKYAQIIVTTHSPYIVRFCNPDEVLLADKINGVTEMIRVDDVAKINEFLENFTIDELWLQRYLGRGTPL